MKIPLLKKIWISSWAFLSYVLPKHTAQWALSIFLSPIRIPRPRSEEFFFKTAKKYTIQNRIAAFEWGLPEHPLVILLHGWSGRGTQMAGFADSLVENGFRVVALDGPAHGDSQGTTTHVGEFSQFLIDIQSELGPYHTVIAHSFGAGCSVLATSRGLRVQKLVLIAGPSRYELVVRFFLKSLKLSQRSQNYFITALADRVKLPVSEMNVGVIGNTISTPVLVIHDEQDHEVSVKAAEEIKLNWPTAELLITSGLGHRRVLRDPKVIASTVKFIART